MLPKRSIKELQTRYKLEPELDDIFVEGDFDKELIDCILRNKEQIRPVYLINSVEIDKELLNKHNLTSGNKQRLIALCLELNLKEETKITFIVDKDKDYWIDNIQKRPGLAYTKYCDMISYFITNFMTKKIALDAGKVKVKNWDEFYESFVECCSTIFLIRLSLHSMNLDYALPDFLSCASVTENEVRIDVDKFIEKICHKNSGIKNLPDIKSELNKWRQSTALSEAQEKIRGHDYVNMLSWSIKKLRGGKNVSEIIPRLFIGFSSYVSEDICNDLRV